MAVAEHLDHFQRRHPAAALPLAIVYKYVDDSGGYLAALIAYYGFVSLFPLLLLLSTILGIVLADHPGLQQHVLNSATHQFPVVGSQLRDPRHIGGGPVGLAVGILGSLYGGLGVAQAMQYAMNTAWRVPRNNRPNPIKLRGRGLLLLATAGMALLGTTALSLFGGTTARVVGSALPIVVFLASVAVNTIIFVFAFRIATTRELSVRDVVPGAVAAAALWQLLQSFGVLYVRHVVSYASAINGVFALVLGMLAFLYMASVGIVLCVELNAVRVDRLYPRSLLTPFTDDVALSAGDRRAYSAQAKAERMKGFEEVDVQFEPVAEPSDRDSANDQG